MNGLRDLGLVDYQVHLNTYPFMQLKNVLPSLEEIIEVQDYIRRLFNESIIKYGMQEKKHQ